MGLSLPSGDSRVCLLRHYWPFGPDTSLLWGAVLGAAGGVSSSPNHVFDARSTTKVSTDRANVPGEGEVAPS